MTDRDLWVRSWDGPQEAPPVVCLHALGGSGAHWVGVAPLLARLGSTQAVDLGGHGHTSETVGVTLERNRELLAQLLGRTGPAVLIGSSFGGGVALLQAATDPTSVRGVVLTGSMLPPVSARPSALRSELIQRRLRQRGSDVADVVQAIRDGRLVNGGLQEYLLRGNAFEPEAMDSAVVEEIVSQPRRAWPKALRTTLDAGLSSWRLMTDWDRFRATIATISAPVLVIHGDRDRTVPVAQALAVSRARPDWRVEIFDRVGHLPHLEQPARWFSVVQGWWPETQIDSALGPLDL